MFKFSATFWSTVVVGFGFHIWTTFSDGCNVMMDITLLCVEVLFETATPPNGGIEGLICLNLPFIHLQLEINVKEGHWLSQ